MRRVRELALLIMTIVFLTGCVQKNENTNTTVEKSIIKALETNVYVENIQSSIKNYILKTDKEEGIPQIIINESDKTFSFSYDVLSSCLATGTYTENDERLELKTDDGKYYYTFDIVDDNTLKYNQKDTAVDSYELSNVSKNQKELPCPGSEQNSILEP